MGITADTQINIDMRETDIIHIIKTYIRLVISSSRAKRAKMLHVNQHCSSILLQCHETTFPPCFQRILVVRSISLKRKSYQSQIAAAFLLGFRLILFGYQGMRSII